MHAELNGLLHCLARPIIHGAQTMDARKASCITRCWDVEEGFFALQS